MRGRSVFFFSSRRRHTRSLRDWSSDVCSSDLRGRGAVPAAGVARGAHARASRGASRRPARRAGRAWHRRVHAGARVSAPTPGSGERLGPVERVALVLALAIVARSMLEVRGYLTDDTFIHLQYARHLAAGAGPVFNVGERVYGCTSPLWIGLIALGIKLGGDGLVVAKALGGA